MFLHAQAQGRPCRRTHGQANHVQNLASQGIRDRSTTCSSRRRFSDEFSIAKMSFEQTIDLIAEVYLRHTRKVLPRHGVLYQHWRNASLKKALYPLTYNYVNSNSMHVSGETHFNSEWDSFCRYTSVELNKGQPFGLTLKIDTKNGASCGRVQP